MLHMKKKIIPYPHSRNSKQIFFNNTEPLLFKLFWNSVLKIEKIGNKILLILSDINTSREGPSFTLCINEVIEISSKNKNIVINGREYIWPANLHGPNPVRIESKLDSIHISGFDQISQIFSIDDHDLNGFLLIPQNIRILHHSASPLEERLSYKGLIDNKRTVFIPKASFSFNLRQAIQFLAVNQNSQIVSLEDSPEYNNRIEVLLRQCGFRHIHSYHHPKQLLEDLHSKKLVVGEDDLIVTDNHMPGFRGADLIITIRTRAIPFEGDFW